MIEKNNRKIAEHVFNGATTMTGVCVTIIALFRIMQGGIGTSQMKFLQLIPVYF